MAFISNGTTILDNGAFDVSLGGLVLLSEQTASGSASISFTSGIGSNYNVIKTTTAFVAFHYENDSSALLSYASSADLAQSTANQTIAGQISTANSKNASGSLYLFNPSSTTFVKHFISNSNAGATDGGGDLRSLEYFVAGYGNTTSAINAIRFLMASGNIDDGIIKMYGIKGS
jgi:hypothetical protein